MLDVCCLMRSPSSAQDMTQLPIMNIFCELDVHESAGCDAQLRLEIPCMLMGIQPAPTPKGIRHNGLIRPHQGKMVVSIPALRPHSNDTYPKDSETKIRPRFT